MAMVDTRIAILRERIPVYGIDADVVRCARLVLPVVNDFVAKVAAA
jgi:hypothetical protein